MFVFFFKQKTAYERRISDWSSDVCSSDLPSSTSRRAQPRPIPEPPPVTSAERPSSPPLMSVSVLIVCVRVEWCQTRILQWLGLIGWFDATSAPLPGTMRSDQAPHHQTEEHLTGEHYQIGRAHV